MLVRALIFIVVFGALQLLWAALDGSRLHHAVIDRGVVAPAAVVAAHLMPTLGPYADGDRLRDSAGGLRIVNGCDGTETLFLLIAGFVVAPLSARGRVKGLLIGIPVVYTLNLARILALLYAQQRDRPLFDFLHGIVTPILMVVSIAAFYYAWLRFANPAQQPARSS